MGSSSRFSSHSSTVTGYNGTAGSDARADPTPARIRRPRCGSLSQVTETACAKPVRGVKVAGSTLCSLPGLGRAGGAVAVYRHANGSDAPARRPLAKYT